MSSDLQSSELSPDVKKRQTSTCQIITTSISAFAIIICWLLFYLYIVFIRSLTIQTYSNRASLHRTAFGMHAFIPFSSSVFVFIVHRACARHNISCSFSQSKCTLSLTHTHIHITLPGGTFEFIYQIHFTFSLQPPNWPAIPCAANIWFSVASHFSPKVSAIRLLLSNVFYDF